MNKIAYIALLTALGALIAHILIILSAPFILSHEAWKRFDNEKFYNHFTILPESDPIKKSSDPLFDLALCSFDLSKKPIKIAGSNTPLFWSLSVYDARGENLYSINSYALPHKKLNLILSTPFQQLFLKKRQLYPAQNIVLLPQNLKKGFVILRNFAPSLLAQKESLRFLQNAQCQTIK